MKKSRFLFAVCVALAMTLMHSCFSDEEIAEARHSPNAKIEYDSLVYESITYKTVKIGNQNWMAENLNYDIDGSRCGTATSCDAYGKLYNWAMAMNLPDSCNLTVCASQVQANNKGICPEGWHIPSNADWDELVNAVGGALTAGKYLKATSGWSNFNGQSGNGNDKYGFAALPGGSSNFSDGSLYGEGNYYGSWWSALEFDYRGAYNRSMYYGDGQVTWGSGEKTSWLSVRCIESQ